MKLILIFSAIFLVLAYLFREQYWYINIHDTYYGISYSFFFLIPVVLVNLWSAVRKGLKLLKSSSRKSRE